MSTKRFLLGNEAMARGSIEAGVKVVAGYPGTPATEILTAHLERPDVHVEWSINEKVAMEVAIGAALANTRALAVMKHNGTNYMTDTLMHVAFTGVRGGLVLVSADDPNGNSSQNEEDTRIIAHTYAHLPVFDPSSAQEAKDMMKEAFALSEKTELCVVLRPVMRICHSRSLIEVSDEIEPQAKADFVDDRKRFVMSAVVEPSEGGAMRPVVRHRWLNEKQKLLGEIVEQSPFNSVEEGEGKVGIVGCGVSYAYVKEAECILGRKYPVLKLCTLPLPRQKVLAFAKGKDTIIVYEELEPVVAKLIKEILFDAGVQVKVLGRDGFVPAESELSTEIVLRTLAAADPTLEYQAPEPVKLDFPVPARTRTQCIGCGYRGLLHGVKLAARRTKGVVTGDIGCHDAGSFPPLELQSTIYCMGASVPIASGIEDAGFDKPVFSIIGDSTFFHNGMLGFINGLTNKNKVITILCDNRTTAMTGFQPHPGSGQTVRGEDTVRIDTVALAEAMGVEAQVVDPYDIKGVQKALDKAIKSEKGMQLIISRKPCYLLSRRTHEQLFEPRDVSVDQERCNGCKICIDYFGCPAISIVDGKAQINQMSCVKCGMCVEVCKRGAIK